VDEGGGVEGVAVGFAGEFGRGEPAEFVVHRGERGVRREGVGGHVASLAGGG